jgi:uncharacterized protein (DUF2252 family)
MRPPADVPGLYRPLDIARRVAGNASLGLPRFIALTRGRNAPYQQFLLDIKLAPPATAPALLTLPQPAWPSEAARVVSLQRILQAAPHASSQPVKIGGDDYVMKELQPSADRLDWQRVIGERADHGELLGQLAALSAWAHLRGAGRLGSASVDDLQAFAGRKGLIREYLRAAQVQARRTISDWRRFSRDYDLTKKLM